MYLKKLILSTGLMMLVTLSFAQFRYKGMQAIGVEYGIQTRINAQKLNAQYTLGYHYFLDRNLYVEFNAQYEQRPYSNSYGINFYDVKAEYLIENYFVSGSLNLTLFDISNRLFFDVGLGATTGMRFIKEVSNYEFAINKKRQIEFTEKSNDKITPEEPTKNQGTYKEKWLVGLNAPITLELYFSRYFSIIGRYRTKFFIRESTDKWIFDTTVGAKIHF